MADLKTAGVDHQGLMKVLAEHLYSTPEIVLRELVQNACDSIVRRRLEHDPHHVGQVTVIANPAEGTLVLRDDGAGLTHDEIERYLATVGGGFTRVLREEHGDEGLIGAFGLGFLSSYVVAELVEVVTTSHHDPSRSHHFRSRDGLRFSIDEGPPRDVGTEVILHLKREHASLSEPARVGALLRKYCRLLPIAVNAPHLVNADAPSWRQDLTALHPVRKRQIVLKTADSFDPRFSAMAAFELEAVEGLDAKGVVWVHDGASWATSDNRGVTVYVRGMMVTEDARELLPEWAGFAGAVIESNALQPTASREDLQRDQRWSRLQEALRITLANGLRSLATEQPATWRRVVRRHNDSLLGGALADPGLFQLLRNELEVPTSEGRLPLQEISRRSGGPIAVAVGDDSGYEQLLHRAMGRPVVDGTRFGAATLASRWGEQSGVPILTLGTQRGNAELFPPVGVSREQQALLDELFGEPDVAVVASRYAPSVVPLVLVPDREVLLKRRLEDEGADKRISKGLLSLARGFAAEIEREASATLYVNLDNPIVARVLDKPDARARAAVTILRSTADLTARGGTEGLERDLPTALSDLSSAVMALLA